MLKYRDGTALLASLPGQGEETVTPVYAKVQGVSVNG
jgi:hypothetical protein